MIEHTIDWCDRNRLLVVIALITLVLAGAWSVKHIPLDALPDISDVQVIIHTQWIGQPPGLLEDQVTYPIVSTMLAAPRVKAVRAQTMPGASYVFVVFQDGTDLYWARSRVLGYLEQLRGRLPAGVNPEIGPDATGAGWVYEYVVLDRDHRLSLPDLHALQKWDIRYALETVPGVAEVATIGGFVRQYQVKLDPHRMLALGVSLRTVIDRIRDSNNETGGSTLDLSGASYMVRSLGYIHSLKDIEDIPVAVHNGTPVLIRDLGVVSFGPAIREGAADWNGKGETVGGIVIMRYGENALNVIDGVKARLREIQKTLPPGLEIKTAYDRSELISGSIATLTRTLLEEGVIVSLVIVLFLFHFRSALIPILTIPVALIISFIPMYYLRVSSNIMSLGGFALAIGILVDASIVMVENGHRRLANSGYSAGASGSSANDQTRHDIVIAAAKQVGRPLFYSLLIIVVVFLPVFLLEAQEGRMFRPLAWTKTFAITCSSLAAVTIVPILMVALIRGRGVRDEARNPLSRFFRWIYLPIISWCLRHRATAILLSVLFFALTLPLAGHIGSQFMPPLFEGSVLYMPTALPGISIASASRLLQEQDRIIRSVPEVASVFGTVGRSDSATDNAPLDMYDTTIMLKSPAQWPRGMTYDRLVQAMDAKLRFPGLTNTFTMPVENRLDMELTGIKTPVGLKIQGPDLNGIRRIGAAVEEILSGVAGTRGVFAERTSQGFYIDIAANRAIAAQYGLTVGDVQTAVAAAIGGSDITTIVNGRERFPLNVRYLRDYRDSLNALRRVLITTPSGAQIPLGEVASVTSATGPTMIRDENGRLTGYVYIDLAGSDYGGYVARAQKALDMRLKLPQGYTLRWSGEYVFELRAKHRLALIVPIVFAAIFVLLYILFRSAGETLIMLFPCLFALIGGLLLQYLMGLNFSVAVAVGYIDLFGIAIETGVVMIIYLDEALDLRIKRGAVDRTIIEAATLEGAVHRLRPKLMTVAVVVLSLAPILWESGIGADVMKPIAAPIVGGMVTSTIAIMILVPVFFAMLKEHELKRGTLEPSAGIPGLD